MMVCLVFCRAGDGIQGLVQVRQVPYPESHSSAGRPSSKCFVWMNSLDPPAFLCGS
jgi:hypothetical protein